MPVFIVDWTFSHLERLNGSISVLENGPRESHTRIPILTLYLVSLLVSVQQANGTTNARNKMHRYSTDDLALTKVY